MAWDQEEILNYQEIQSIFRGLAVFITIHHMFNILLNVTLYIQKVSKLS